MRHQFAGVLSPSLTLANTPCTMDWSPLVAYGRTLNAGVACDAWRCALEFPDDYVQTRDGTGVFCEWLRVARTADAFVAEISLAHACGKRVVRAAQCRSVASLLLSMQSSLQCIDDMALVWEAEPSCAVREHEIRC